MGDECQKIILNTKGSNESEVERSLVDFLHYIDNSSEESIYSECDERLKHLHRKIHEIKSNEQMGVSYMKMEERDRLIREEGEKSGEIKSIISMIRIKKEKGYDDAKIAEDLELERDYTVKIIDIINALSRKGATLVALRLFFDNRGRAKLEVGLGRGKKNYDKREAIKNRELDRKMRIMGY